MQPRMHRIQNPLDQCEIKLLAENTGQFEGYLSTFNHTDSNNDTILPGAFKKTLAERKAPLPLLLGHNHYDPGAVIGKWLELQEDIRVTKRKERIEFLDFALNELDMGQVGWQLVFGRV